MEFFSVKESVTDPSDFLSTFQGAGDCILNDLLDFPQCTLGAQSEDVYSLDSSLKAEPDSWNNSKFDASQTTEFRLPCQDQEDVSSSAGGFFTYFSADSFPDKGGYTDSILPPDEMPISDGFNSLAMNTSPVDVLDYLDDSRSSFNLTSKSPSHYNTGWEHDALFLRSESIIEAETKSESLNESKFCYNPTCSFSSINPNNWLTDNAQLEWTSLAEDTCNTINEIVEKPADYFECNAAGWTDWSLQSQQDEKDLRVEQFCSSTIPVEQFCSSTIPVEQFCSSTIYTAASAMENTFTSPLTVKEAVPLSSTCNVPLSSTCNVPLSSTCNVPLSSTCNLQASSGDGSHFWHINESINVEEFSEGQSGSKSSLNNINNTQVVNQGKGAEHSLREKISVYPLVTTLFEWQLPFSTEIQTDLPDLNNNVCSNMTTTVPLSNACGQLDETGPINDDNCESAARSKSYLSNTQRKKPLGDINRAANNERKLMKVGKRDCFVTVPANEVNKLMVRDLLSMSGNRQEISMKDSTQEYRSNIRKMYQQKRKRLNIIRVLNPSTIA